MRRRPRAVFLASQQREQPFIPAPWPAVHVKFSPTILSAVLLMRHLQKWKGRCSRWTGLPLHCKAGTYAKVEGKDSAAQGKSCRWPTAMPGAVGWVEKSCRRCSTTLRWRTMR